MGASTHAPRFREAVTGTRGIGTALGAITTQSHPQARTHAFAHARMLAQATPIRPSPVAGDVHACDARRLHAPVQ
eukprot:4479471-Prymnesium_polylepis.1